MFLSVTLVVMVDDDDDRGGNDCCGGRGVDGGAEFADDRDNRDDHYDV